MERERGIKRPEKGKQMGSNGKGIPKQFLGCCVERERGQEKKNHKRAMEHKRKKTDPREAHELKVRAVIRTREGSAGSATN